MFVQINGYGSCEFFKYDNAQLSGGWKTYARSLASILELAWRKSYIQQ